MRGLKPVAIGTFALTIASAVCLAAESKLVLTLPGVKWSLRIDLPDFVLEPRKTFRDSTQVWAGAQNRQSGLGLKIFISKVGEVHDAVSCRKYYLPRLADQRSPVAVSERKGMALVEQMLAAAGGGSKDKKSLHAYLFRDGYCVDLHLTKPRYRDDQQALMFAVLDAVTLGPATDEERTQMAAYVISSGPGEEITIEAARTLRDKRFAAADALLARPCPWAADRPADKEFSGSVECALRAAGDSEARALKSPQDLSRMYWRAADLARREGALQAAEQIYRKSLDLDPDQPQSWYALGQVYREQRNLNGALEALRHVLEQKPDSAEAMYWVAITLMDQGKLDEADAMLARAVQADPKDGRIWYRRGQVQAQRADYAKAIESFKTAGSAGFGAKLVEQRIDECRKAMSERSRP